MRCHITLPATILLALSLPVATINAGDPPPPEEIRLSSPCHDAMLSACQAGESENATICEMLRGTRVEDSTSLLDFFNNVMDLPGHDDLICARLFGTKVFTGLRYGSAYWDGDPSHTNVGASTYEPPPKISETYAASSSTSKVSEQETQYYVYTAPDGTLTFSDTPPTGGADDLTPYQPRSRQEEIVRPPVVTPPPKRDIQPVSVYCGGSGSLIGETKEIQEDLLNYTGDGRDPNQLADLTLTIEGEVSVVRWQWVCGETSAYHTREYGSGLHGPHQPTDYRLSTEKKAYGISIQLNPCHITRATSTISRGTSLQDHVTGLKRIMGEWFRYHMGEGPRPTFPPQSEK